MRVFLTFTTIGTSFPYMLPISVAALSAYLKREGIDTRLFMTNNPRQFADLPRMLDEYKPHVVGISATSCQAPYVDLIAEMAKKHNGDVPVIAGGNYPSLMPKEVLECPHIDAVCRGEGEISFLEYVRSVESGKVDTSIPNIWFKENGGIIQNKGREYIQDLDSLPFVDRDFLDYQEIIDASTHTVFTIVSRGCLWDCTFCSNPYLKPLGTGTYTRNRSPSNVMEEFAEMEKKFDFSYIFFRDDTFTWDREWTLEFCEKYARRFSYPFDILTRADCLDEEVIQALAVAGCRASWVGADSGNPRIRNEILRKDTNNQVIVEMCDLLHKHNINAVVTNMVGLPEETLKEHQDTIDLNKRIYRDHVNFSIGSGTSPKIFVFNPFHGTALYHHCKKKGWLKTMSFGHRAYKDSYIDMPQFTRKEVDRAYRLFRYRVHKETHPAVAWMYRLYDSKVGQYIWERMPRAIFGKTTELFTALYKKRARSFSPRNPSPLDHGSAGRHRESV